MALRALGRHEDAGLVFEGVIEADEDATCRGRVLSFVSELAQPDAALACQKQVLRIRGGAVPPLCRLLGGGDGARRLNKGIADAAAAQPVRVTPWLAVGA